MESSNQPVTIHPINPHQRNREGRKIVLESCNIARDQIAIGVSLVAIHLRNE